MSFLSSSSRARSSVLSACFSVLSSLAFAAASSASRFLIC
jgi:hypothetical protein